ncbi:LysR family transcriptional regulator [Sphingomonas sp.]|uniref:LysR family transcriptional regulator n=1 Tax=Sphingomonas sp. TaxID=28214 RepID=UPI0031D11163
MRFKGLDLNLVVALHALLELRSVSAAAERLHITQPAMSAALARLRVYFGDDLVVLVGRRMIPTPFAEELRSRMEALVREADRFVGSTTGFEPAISERRFRIATSDYIMVVVIAPLLARLEQEAPGVKIDVFPTGPEVHERLNRGELDLIVGPEVFLAPGLPRRALFVERHVLLGWRHNPLFARTMTLDDFLAAGHVAVRIGMDRQYSFAERHLEAYAERRRVEVTTTNFSSVPHMLVGTHRIAVLQERLVAVFSASLPLVSQPLPFDIPLLNELVQYHPTRGSDPGIEWLVRRMREVTGAGTAIA